MPPTRLFSVVSAAPGTVPPAWPSWPGWTMGLSSTTDLTGRCGCLASIAYRPRVPSLSATTSTGVPASRYSFSTWAAIRSPSTWIDMFPARLYGIGCPAAFRPW